MPAPLSRDWRERIVRAVAGGSSIRQTALRFAVSPSVAVKLVRRFRQGGDDLKANDCAKADQSFCSRLHLYALMGSKTESHLSESLLHTAAYAKFVLS
jgi:hypothetical protein